MIQTELSLQLINFRPFRLSPDLLNSFPELVGERESYSYDDDDDDDVYISSGFSSRECQKIAGGESVGYFYVSLRFLESELTSFES